MLELQPTLTADQYGEEFLSSGELDLWAEDPDHPCNIEWDKDNLCYDRPGPDIIKPLQMPRLSTKHSFAYKYGRLEVGAYIFFFYPLPPPLPPKKKKKT